MDTSTARKASEPMDACDEQVPELLARLRSGDSEAFEQIVAFYQDSTARLVARLLGSPQDVEDVVQDVFVSVLQNLDRFRGESRFSTWLTSITINRCRWYHRRRALRDRVLQLLWRQPRRGDCTGGPDAADRHELIRDAVRRLPARYREPVVLRYFEELSIAEIGDILNLSTNAVEVRLTRARAKLKRLFSEPEEDQSPHER